MRVPYHSLVVLSIDSDHCLFDDSVCDLMEVTEHHPVFIRFHAFAIFLFSIQLDLLQLALFFADPR